MPATAIPVAFASIAANRVALNLSNKPVGVGARILELDPSQYNTIYYT